MSYEKADKAVYQMLASGFIHHRYEDESASDAIFYLERNELVARMNSEVFNIMYTRYLDVLAPEKLRAAKNSMICLLTCLCRMAIKHGVDVEHSYALSDYYINELERSNDEVGLVELLREILLHYYDLAANANTQIYTKPIAFAIRYIGRNLYGQCRVSELAEYAGLEPHYFSALFSKQVGMSPSSYIMKKKLEEAQRMLKGIGVSATDVAVSLGFYDLAHFSKCFKKEFGISPSEFAKKDIVSPLYSSADR